jgi:hypothetical protein
MDYFVSIVFYNGNTGVAIIGYIIKHIITKLRFEYYFFLNKGSLPDGKNGLG